jgi:ATP-independent RNA helicase DbpA
VIEQVEAHSVIVFCNFKASVTGLAEELARLGQNVGALHGDLDQADRDRIMAKFRNRSVSILVATDVAARGIDVESLDLVVNYELPAQSEIYVHRVGRTGRAGNRGLAVSLASVREGAKLENIENYAKITLEIKTLPDLKGFSPSSTGAQGVAAMKTLFIGAGRKDKMRPGDILGALTGEQGCLSGADIGKIEIHDRFSYVAVSAGVADAALERLRNGRIKGRKVRVESVR